MAFDILCKEYKDHYLYSISKSVYFRIVKGYSDYMEYYLYCGDKTFYATNDKLFPLDIFDNSMQENYITSIHYAEGDIKSKFIYNRYTNEKSGIQLIEYHAAYAREVICKKDGNSLFEMRETKALFSNPKMTLKGHVEGNELELFITFLSFRIVYPDVEAW